VTTKTKKPEEFFFLIIAQKTVGQTLVAFWIDRTEGGARSNLAHGKTTEETVQALATQLGLEIEWKVECRHEFADAS